MSDKNQPQPQELMSSQRLESSASVPQRLSDTQQQVGVGEHRRTQPTGSMPNLASSPLSSSSSSDITSERSGWVSSHRSSPSSSPPPGQPLYLVIINCSKYKTCGYEFVLYYKLYFFILGYFFSE